ncbi:MAG: zinc-dependent peptidase [Akkermansiaceae bacterium]
MTGVYIILTVVTLVALGFLLQSVIVHSRRRRWLQLRLSDEERQSIGRDFTIFSKLPDALRDDLEGLMHVFIREKSFEACGGLKQVSIHMQHVIAAQACLLIVNRKHDYYRKLRSILIYPSAYKAGGKDGGHDVRLGESWESGSVVLSWDSVIAGGRNHQDGQHVSLHEFAHQLDQAGGDANGAPELTGSGCYREWSVVFLRAFERFQSRLQKGKKTVIDPYGATNPAEFFAVATETFYEKPKQLREHYPAVYDQLKGYYRVDPLEW